jgi:hypothetical protein
MKRIYRTTENFRVGERVSNPKHGEGVIVNLKAGPFLNKIGVIWDNPIQQMLGTEPVDPNSLTKI